MADTQEIEITIKLTCEASIDVQSWALPAIAADMGDTLLSTAQSATVKPISYQVLSVREEAAIYELDK